jgi:hypothetical protein
MSIRHAYWWHFSFTVLPDIVLVAYVREFAFACVGGAAWTIDGI